MLILMLSSFDPRPGEDVATFASDHDAFNADLRAAGITAGAGPLGRRVNDTPMEAEEAHTQTCFSVMQFHDCARPDAAYAHINARARPGTSSYLRMYRHLTTTVFLCREDVSHEKETQ